MQPRNLRSGWLATLVLATILAGSAQSAAPIPRDRSGLPTWQERQWDDFPILIRVSEVQTPQDILARVALTPFNREDLRPDGRWEVRVTEAQAGALTRAGIAFERLPDREKSGRQAMERAWAARQATGAQWVPQSVAPLLKSDAAALTYYPTHTEIGTLLADLEALAPAICDTFIWGESVQGRELWGIVISGDVQNTTAEPEVRLSSTMHGNEVVGTVMLIDLAYHLVQNYNQPGYEDLTELVNTTEIHLMPLHNPDGYVSGQRYNANGKDLNRDYLLPNGDGGPVETENQHFMAYANNHHFVVSQNGHGGSLVVNYTWDYTYTLAPDDAAIIQLSLEYSTYNLPMYNGGFTQGITNGAAWYVANGTLQDWSYDQTDCIDVTVELGYSKTPPATSLASLWDDNRESLLHFMAAAHYGIHGVVTDAGNGAPLDATVSVAGNSKSVHTDPAHGDYYKLLASGTYDLTITAPGYQTVTATGVATTWGTPTVLDVAMWQSGMSDVPGAKAGGPHLTAMPNPFNPATRLTVDLPAAGVVDLGIYDLRGQRVRRLLAAEPVTGARSLVWDGRDDRGEVLPSGVYFARARTAAGQATRKLMLVK